MLNSPLVILPQLSVSHSTSAYSTASSRIGLGFLQPNYSHVTISCYSKTYLMKAIASSLSSAPLQSSLSYWAQTYSIICSTINLVIEIPDLMTSNLKINEADSILGWSS